jgi:hypothetical protein
LPSSPGGWTARIATYSAISLKRTVSCVGSCGANDRRLPLVGHQPATAITNRSDIHDGEGLRHPLNVELKTASAEKWDTTAFSHSALPLAVAAKRG